MTPVAETHRIAPDFLTWSGYNPDVRCDCGSAAALTTAGWVVFDPIPLADTAWADLTELAPVAAIALTSGNHQRESLTLSERFKVPVHAPAAARTELRADVWHDEGGEVCGFRLVALPGAATGESVWCDGRSLIIGDALIHLDGLAVLPDKYCEDPNLLRTSLRKLTALTFERAAFAHGDPVPVRARELITGFLDSF